MKSLVLLSFCCVAVLALPSDLSYQETDVIADPCTADVCKSSDGCRCATSVSPLGDEEIPQLISLTFDEAVTDDLYKNYWEPLLFSRTNPDEKPIGATFFVPHEYTDYERVNDLYNYGFEIGVHSITKDNLQQYWRSASEELLEKEFGGQKHILNKFGNIPEEDIIGVRTPQLQLAANYSIEAYVAAGLQYDSSWPTLPVRRLFPYTLDYLSSQQCLLGAKCPNEAFKGFWVLPINDFHGEQNRECNTLASCNVTGTAEEIATWLLKEINDIRESSKVPITLLLESHWFDFTENSLEAFTKVLDTIATYSDTFLVTQKQVLDWIRNPVPLSQFQTDFPDNRQAPCTPFSCKLQKPNGQDRYLKSCIPCPDNYPWLDNPDGN